MRLPTPRSPAPDADLELIFCRRKTKTCANNIQFTKRLKQSPVSGLKKCIGML